MRLRHTFDDPKSEKVVVLGPGEMFVVPKGVQHCPGAENEVCVLMAERKGELNTGDLGVT
jgi:mannose-6-phosphate isomerase-like protein (cupin superfamily)